MAANVYDYYTAGQPANSRQPGTSLGVKMDVPPVHDHPLVIRIRVGSDVETVVKQLLALQTHAAGGNLIGEERDVRYDAREGRTPEAVVDSLESLIATLSPRRGQL